MKILALYYRDTKNIGDLSCCPISYFNFFSRSGVQVFFRDLRLPPPELSFDMIIWGGGALGKMPDIFFSKYPETIKVAWGVGIKENTKEAHQIASFGFDLYGSRNYGVTHNYLPCVSCMSDLFDKDFKIKYDVVVYGHAMRPLKSEAKILKIPYMDNQANSIDEVINFLGSANIVITNSYHGAYWSTLLGKRCSMIPYGTKFFNLKHKPAIVDDIKVGIRVALSHKFVLEEARYLNNNFSKKVNELLQSIG